MPGGGYGVAAGVAAAILFGGVLGAGTGTVILYAGALEADPSIPNIFADAPAAEVAAHSVAEKKIELKAASVMEPKRSLRGFAAMFS